MKKKKKKTNVILANDNVYVYYMDWYGQPPDVSKWNKRTLTKREKKRMFIYTVMNLIDVKATHLF